MGIFLAIALALTVLQSPLTLGQRPPKCKKPWGKVNQLRQIGCSQAVCTRKGQTAKWKICPAPANQADVKKIDDNFGNMNQDLNATQKSLRNVSNTLEEVKNDVIEQLNVILKKVDGPCGICNPIEMFIIQSLTGDEPNMHDGKKEDEETLNNYRDAFSNGNVTLMVDLLDPSFNFLLMPAKLMKDSDSFEAFFIDFKSAVEKKNISYSMEFENVSNFKICNILFEVGNWLIPDAMNGAFLHAVKDEKIILDIATDLTEGATTEAPETKIVSTEAP